MVKLYKLLLRLICLKRKNLPKYYTSMYEVLNQAGVPINAISRTQPWFVNFRQIADTIPACDAHFGGILSRRIFLSKLY